jgi:hypothetical protein
VRHAEAVPFLNDLDRDFGARGLAVLGIDLDEDRQDALDFLAKYPAEFEQAADAAGDCPRSFGVETMPASYLIDRQGMIRYVHAGFRQRSGAARARPQLSRSRPRRHAGRRAARATAAERAAFTLLCLAVCAAAAEVAPWNAASSQIAHGARAVSERAAPSAPTRPRSIAGAAGSGGGCSCY